MNNQPLVSVPVITYNSSKFVLETLESIKAQTYQNIELIISDDCSTDNTVELCRKWVEENKERFVRTQIITSETNTGVSANLNRAEAACQGEWVKGIAGDDLLKANCITDCVEFACQNNSKCLFGKIEAFGENREYANYITETFAKRNDEMLSMTLNNLYDFILDGNTPPAPAFFYNRKFFIDNQITNDVRIPMIEDLPKWLNILKKGIQFDFLDSVIVEYRLGGISTGETWHKPELFLNQRKMYFYYQLDDKYNKDKYSTIESLISFEYDIYKQSYSIYQDLLAFRNSHAYRFSTFLLTPFKYIKSIFSK
ncbi:MAG: glycosyltransferase family 2 protein [Paludibacteraceae bacterium]|nr:glycosyltransferase family 2 protein [Paludibacteraceae bacterium]